MRKAFVLLALLVSGAGCLAAGPYPEAGAPGSGVTGVTIKRAAVHDPDTLDFGGDVETVENDDLDASTAGMNKTVGDADVARDIEIDAIVDSFGDDERSPASVTRPATVPAGRRPAVPPLPGSSESATSALGITAATTTVPPAPVRSRQRLASTDPRDQALAERQERIFPRPLWRRVHQVKTASQPPQEPMARGF